MPTEYFSTKLSLDYTKLLETSNDYNVIIEIGELDKIPSSLNNIPFVVSDDEEKFKTFKAHSLILKSRCKYFEAALSYDWEWLLNLELKDLIDHLSNECSWGTKEYNTLGKSLENLSTKIRFIEFLKSDFIKFIIPFKEIFNIEFYNELQDHFYILLPSPPPKQLLFNNLNPMDNQHISDKNDSRSGSGSMMNATSMNAFLSSANVNHHPSLILKPPYTFTLLYRASRDSFNLDNLHKIIDYKVNILIVARISNTNELIGGYNPIGWDDSNKPHPDSINSFIFSFRDNNPPSSPTSFSPPLLPRISRLKRELIDKIVFNSKTGYISFGSGSDLRIGGVLNPKTGHTKLQYYENKIRDFQGIFYIDDYEVFQIS
ncbi:9153_t:CDS:2 [Funneliformis geosporum]|uniref:1236_t:CDS:1 n=1 Tax=Funneliformis geosporum TaxID=1117311 RepID=A0A9W4SKH4_9GLOM|nr:9153_t:CDS:2 [Funneliformis geosporum]CAI2171926.1 1236_t:CDS:2 [Funneliformis geosporum]